MRRPVRSPVSRFVTAAKELIGVQAPFHQELGLADADELDRLFSRRLAMRDIDDLDPFNIEAKGFRQTNELLFWADENWNDHSRLSRLQRPAERGLVTRMCDSSCDSPQTLGRRDETLIFLMLAELGNDCLLIHGPAPCATWADFLTT